MTKHIHCRILGAWLTMLALCQAQVPARDSRLPNGSEFPSWEKPLQFSKTYYVDGSSARADDNGPGTQGRPFRTIGKAAEVLQAGERVVIAQGIYREAVHPARGGSAPDKMISYEAAEGANVAVRGSVVLKDGWKPSANLQGGGGPETRNAKVWQIRLDGKLFEGYNPFGMVNMPQQRWQYMNRMSLNVHNILVPYTRGRGILFVDGKPLDQVRVASELFVRNPSWAALGVRGQPYSAELFHEMGGSNGKYWVEEDGLTLHVRLPGDDSPDKHTVEITTKEQVFAPTEPRLGYVRIKGITFEHAGNGFPFPQRGMVSTNGGHHWIIEGNTIQWANSIGLDVGLAGGGGGGGGFAEFGAHIIRGNVIRYCGICGLAGLPGRNLLVEDNLIEWIGWQDAEHMSESAGIKFHNAREVLIRNNVIRHMRHASGLWLDVGNVNCRVTRNVFADILTAHTAIWIEGTHEQDQVDNNIVWGVKEAERLTPPDVETGGGAGMYLLGTDKLIVSQNLFAHCTRSGIHARTEETRIVAGRGGTSRDNKVYNNIFFATGDAGIEFENEHNDADGNLYGGFQGGYLRVLTPGRAELLDIPAGREFHGWEKNGQTAEISGTFDPDTLQLSFATRSAAPKMKVFNGILTDWFGEHTGESRLPGPFSDWTSIQARSVDPRQKTSH